MRIHVSRISRIGKTKNCPKNFKKRFTALKLETFYFVSHRNSSTDEQFYPHATGISRSGVYLQYNIDNTIIMDEHFGNELPKYLHSNIEYCPCFVFQNVILEFSHGSGCPGERMGWVPPDQMTCAHDAAERIKFWKPRALTNDTYLPINFYLCFK